MSSNRKQIDRLNIKFQRVALFVGIILFIIKVAAYYLTKSNAILTDALEGLVNILGAAFGVFSMYYATRPSDQNHPYGHGKIEFISSGFEGALVLLAGVSMVAKSSYSFLYPQVISISSMGIGLVALAGVINYALGWLMVKQGKSGNSVQLQAGGKHLLSDGYSTAGLLIGLIVVWLTGLNFLDNVLAIVLGVLISVTGFKIIRKSIAGVMDEADPEQLDKVAKVLELKRNPAWVDIHNFKIVRYGSKLHLDVHLTLPWYYSLKDSHDEVNALESVLEAVFENDLEASIHAEPCLPVSCGICSLDFCAHRQSKFEKRVPWDKNYIYEDKHHQMNMLK